MERWYWKGQTGLNAQATNSKNRRSTHLERRGPAVQTRAKIVIYLIGSQYIPNRELHGPINRLAAQKWRSRGSIVSLARNRGWVARRAILARLNFNELQIISLRLQVIKFNHQRKLHRRIRSIPIWSYSATARGDLNCETQD